MNIKQKISSRKFQVWLVWLGIVIASMFIDNLPKEIIFQFFGYVSLLYIGANTAQKYLDSK